MTRIGILSQASNFHCQKWASALQKAGFKVVVFSLEHASISKVKVIALHQGKYSYFTFWKTRNALKNAILKERIDILNPMHLTPFGTWARWANVQLPIVAQAMGADVLEYAPPHEPLYPLIQQRGWAKSKVSTKRTFIQQIKHRYFAKQVQKFCNIATYLIPDNEWIAYGLENWFSVPKEKYHIAYWGVETEKFDTVQDKEIEYVKNLLQIKSDQKIVLSPRGIKPIYQADIIFEAFKQVNIFWGDRVKFIMLGASYGGNQSFVRQLNVYAQHNPNFIYLPYLPLEYMPALWKITDVFISAPIYDGYSAALAEGRYAGAIPIVNHTPATENLIFNGRNGFILRNFSIKKLSSVLNATLQNINELKPKFAEQNQKWTLAHGLFEYTVDKFKQIISTLK
ncbi:MAG: glycosyltransferase [Bacteroidia bacterium]|nr:glycosyltransferase [Bacteroidia bacterium]MDW8345424.1 glycosyltransferase [Bacteroidia bacterium]